MPDSQKYTSKLLGARVLIVGGSSGIGYAVAEASLEHGAHVIISSSQERRIQGSISRLLDSYPSAKDRVSGYVCDLSTKDMEENIKGLFSKSGQVDHVVITAGDNLATLPLEEASFENVQKAGMVRFFAPLLIAKHASKHLSAGPASSITLSTGSVAEKPIPDWTIIASYAAGLHGMMRNLALDLAPIRVNLISPGPLDTELWDSKTPEEMKQFRETVESKSTTGKLAQASDVAEAYLYVMRDRNCSGSVVDSNGGVKLV